MINKKRELRTLSAIWKKKLPQRSEVKFEIFLLLKIILMSCSHCVPNFMLYHKVNDYPKNDANLFYSALLILIFKYFSLMGFFRAFSML